MHCNCNMDTTDGLVLNDNYVLVAAIDFGTTFSGYCCSFKSSPEDIYTYTKWGADVNIPHSYKTPTCLLTRENLEFVALGYEAISEYTDIDPDELDSYHFFERFKMTLHSEKGPSPNASISDARGTSFPATAIFGLFMREMKRHLMKQLQVGHGGAPDDELIRWVVTVPAIWTDAAKQFMREAAVAGGIVNDASSSNLLIALEPEAASLFCRNLKGDQYAKLNQNGNTCLSVGDKYLVVDAGGGTLDVTAHEILENGCLAEIHYATGGSMGASEVDKNFLKLVDTILEDEVIAKCSQTSSNACVHLQNAFEIVKRTANPVNEKKAVISINPELFEIYRESFSKSMDQSIRKEYLEQDVHIRNGLLSLPHNLVQSLFSPVVDDIVEFVHNLIKEPTLRDVTKILMVGGFSDCEVLKYKIVEELGEKYSLLIPDEAWCAVMKGAVSFGHNPAAIQSRVAKVTYGISHDPVFDPAKHDESRARVIGGTKRAKHVLKPLIKRGQLLQTKRFIQKPINADQQKLHIKIYITLNDDAVYTNDVGVVKAGDLTVALPGSGSDRKVEVCVRFGGTEITAQARDMREGGEIVSSTISFLDRRRSSLEETMQSSFVDEADI